MRRFALLTTLLLSTPPLVASSLSGRVMQAWSTVGISDVTVIVSVPGGKVAQTVKTDADGNYSIDQLPSGKRVRIKYTRDHFQESPTYHYLTLAEGTNHDIVKMTR